ncbi:TetR/AcrR family transcriptional regulator [Photobacterium toruni]|uniref:Putative HTH-type transcriptional regulator n=1 Tax=Photobacterium toruni TaxID=1935446 RepID=A0A1T4RP26_9GAMM|nr:TetR/AcrR family transcriptional regulator [Photobacterium toruni]MEC6816814.1 TetR/AcrR family transcriptional regulator [Photobacterium toruni]MEC6833924.1 TetR/AcrR family transcriptional regulator [Photobacterium toruni]SKA17702.1 putative HTH-type transcriptional regulator [Photobacterium toruni]
MKDKKERILAATEKLLATHGFHGLSMQMVAKEAQVATGTIYRYFNDKDDLLHQLHEHILGYIAKKISHNINDSMSLKQRYRTMWLNLWHMSVNGEAPLINQGQFQHLPRDNSYEKKVIKKQLFNCVNQMFDEGKACQLFKPLDNEILSTLSLDTSCYLARRKINDGLEITDSELNAAIDASWDAIIQH